MVNQVANEGQAMSALALKNVCDQIGAKPRRLWQTATGKRAELRRLEYPLFVVQNGDALACMNEL